MSTWEKTAVPVPELPETRSIALEQCITVGPFVFTAGQVGWDQDKKLVSPDFDPQARKTLENVEHALRAGGASLQDIISMNVYVTDPRYFAEFARIRAEILGDHLSASTMVGVASLYMPGMLVEMQAVALRRGWGG